MAKIQLSLGKFTGYRSRRSWFFLAALLGVLLCIPLAAYGIFYTNTHLVPMLDSQTTVFLEQTVTPGLIGHSDSFAQILALASGQDVNVLRSPLRQLLEAQPDSIGLRVRSGQLVLFAKNAHVLSDPSLAPFEGPHWPTQEQILAGQHFVVLSPQYQTIIAPTYSTASFWRKITMARLSKLGQGTFLWQPTSILGGSPLVYGLILEQNQGWQITMSLGSHGLEEGLHRASLPDASFVWQHRGDLSALASLSWPQNVLDFLHSPFAPFLLRPGETLVSQGTAKVLGQQLYADDAQWTSAVRVDANAADNLLSDIVQDLTKRFPMAEARRLPDGTMILELKRKADAFLVPGKSLDVIADPTGVITYPHNQFHYTYADGVLNMQSGESVALQNRLSTCLLPDSALEGSVSSTFIESLLWTKVDFSVNQQKMAVCVAW